jgi:hypothetical protein
MSTALYGQEEVPFPGKCHGHSNVRDACRLNNESGRLVDPSVKYSTCGVVARVPGKQEITAQTVRELLDRSSLYLNVRARSSDSADAATYLCKRGKLRGE